MGPRRGQASERARPAHGSLGRRLRRRKAALHRLAIGHGIKVVGVVGSVARGEDGPASDIDLLVELPEGVGLLALGRAKEAREDLLGSPVDLVPEADLKPGVRSATAADLVQL